MAGCPQGESWLYNGHLSNTYTLLCPFGVRIKEVRLYVIQSSAGRNSDVNLNTKSLTQVIGKLDYKKRRLDAILSRLSESQLNDGDSPVA